MDGIEIDDETKMILNAADDYAAVYAQDDRQDVTTDVLNAFYAGVTFGKTLTSKD